VLEDPVALVVQGGWGENVIGVFDEHDVVAVPGAVRRFAGGRRYARALVHENRFDAAPGFSGQLPNQIRRNAVARHPWPPLWARNNSASMPVPPLIKSKKARRIKVTFPDSGGSGSALLTRL